VADVTLTIVVVAVNFSVATTVFAYGLHARAGEMFHPFLRPRLLILSLSAM
jgi:hypothetical protein